MSLLSLTKELCEKKEIIPARSKGQNFLIAEDVFDDILVAADLRPDDQVLEVGPGFGFLTERLARRVKQVRAVELDDKLALALEQRLKEQEIKNVVVLNTDILKFSNNFQYQNIQYQSLKQATRHMSHDYKIVANLPYNISSRFLRQFLASDELRPKMMVLMLQKEVAERVAAQAGEMSLLAVSVQFYSQPEIIKIVPKTAFWPLPEVDSAIIKLEVGNKKLVPSAAEGLEVGSEKEFFRLVKIGFSARRKKLLNNLAAGDQITKAEALVRVLAADLGANVRPQDLSVENWIKLFKISESKQ